jgi:aprataxin
LLLPRNQTLSRRHPLKALSEDPAFLASVRDRAEQLKTVVADELRRKFGQNSATDKPYHSALEELMSNDDPPPPEKRQQLLPRGRDWGQEVLAGVHTHPSMNHLHIHIMSRDMASECMKHKKHYLSFTTSFLVQLDQFPLEEDSPRFHAGDWPSWDMECWRCGKNFKNRFRELKQHLANEFEEWKKE